MTALEKLKSEILPTAVKEGKFGNDKVKFVDYKSDDNFSAKDQYASSIHFGDVILETDKGEHFTQSIVIKTQHDNISDAQKSSLSLGLAHQFYSEFLFYTEILPLLSKCDSEKFVQKMFPKYFYGSVVLGGDLTNDILIFENVQKLGFKLTQSRAFIDYAHIKLTLRLIAKFHALSLVCKRTFPERFKKVVSQIPETYWTEERIKDNCDAFFVENCKRGILPLQNDPNYKHKLKGISAVVEETDLTMAKLVAAVEPLAVICHGDLCRNNIFYKYDSEGVPFEVMFFDLATIRYSSPVIDLSFFLFMNCSPEDRSNHWDDLLGTYYSALTSNPDLDPEATPSLADIKEDFQKHGFYGYVHACYYLPAMLLEEDEVDWLDMSVEDYTKYCVSTGGEESTSYVVDMVKHMIDKNFDFKYIKNIRLKKLRKLGE